MRRGQVALEFITTYGWALMILLVMIGAISYFGVLNPSKLLPSKCQVGSELSCEDFIIQEDGKVELRMKQGVGKTIYVTNISCRTDTEIVTSGTLFNGVDPSAGDVPWSPRDVGVVMCPMTAYTSLVGQKVKVGFEIEYKRSTTGFTHLVAGDVYSAVQ